MAGYDTWEKKSVWLDCLHGLGKGVDLIGDNLQVYFFHIPRHQRFELFPGKLDIVVLGCLHEQKGEVIARVQPLFLGSLDEAVEQTGSIGTIVAAMVDPVFPALNIDANTLLTVITHSKQRKPSICNISALLECLY